MACADAAVAYTFMIDGREELEILSAGDGRASGKQTMRASTRLLFKLLDRKADLLRDAVNRRCQAIITSGLYAYLIR